MKLDKKIGDWDLLIRLEKPYYWGDILHDLLGLRIFIYRGPFFNRLAVEATLLGFYFDFELLKRK